MGGAYLSECALADASEEDKVEEVDVALEVDGLRRRERGGGSGATLTVGRQQTAPIAQGREGRTLRSREH